MSENQGKRRDQIESSEKIIVYTIVGLAIVLSIHSIYYFLKTVING